MNFRERMLQWLLIIHLKLTGYFNPVSAERAKQMLFLTTTMYKLERLKLVQIKTANRDFSFRTRIQTTPAVDNIAKELSTCIYDDGKLLCYIAKDNINEELVETVVDSTPNWLRYDRCKMTDDLHSVLLKNQESKLLA